MASEHSSKQCFICSESNENSLHEHHIVPREYGGSDREGNLTDLCANCHQAIHKLQDSRFFERLREHFMSESVVNGMDIDGEKVLPKDSHGRSLPDNEHVKKRADLVIIGYDAFKNGSYKELLQDWQFFDADSIIERVESRENDIREQFSHIRDRHEKYDLKDDWNGSYDIEPDNIRTGAWVIIDTETDNTFRSRRLTDQHNDRIYQQLHCGYCHRVFNGTEEANLAQHLRVRHRVSDPYDPVDKPIGRFEKGAEVYDRNFGN